MGVIRKTAWGLILDLKRKVKELEANNTGKKFEGEHTEEPPSGGWSVAQGLYLE